MKTVNELLSHLRSLDIKLWAEGQRLRYNAPQGVLTPELRAELAQCKAEILAFLQQADAVLDATVEPIPLVSRDSDLPLSFAQERLWFLEYVGGKSGTYNTPSAQRLIGTLNITALKQAVAQIVQRHEALRTTFKRVKFSAVQIIHPTLTINVPVVDLQGLPLQEQSAEVQRLMAQDIQRPFDLAEGPLLRVLLLRLSEQEHILLVVMHHIISDAWSVGIFMQELSVLYQAFQDGNPSPLPELPIQYADFAHWQRTWLQGEVLESQLNYWRQQLSGKVPALELPIDRPRSPSQSNRAASQSLILSEPLTQALKTLSQQERGSLFITLLTAFKALLHRYTGQEDLLVCFPIAGRNRTETEELIGYFNNIVVTRTDLSGDPSLRTLMKRVRRVAFEAFKHQDTPFQKIGEFPNLVRTPLSRAMFALQNTPKRLLDVPGITASYLEVTSGRADFDIYLIIEEAGEHLTGVLNYNADLFEENAMVATRTAEGIANLLKNYQTLLEQLVANPDRHLSSLPLFANPASATPQTEPWDSLVPIKPKGSKRPLFLIHDGLGRTILYLNLARHLDSERPLYALRPYGREGNPVLHNRVAQMATHYSERIRRVQPAGPYLVGGLSFGGIIAFEVAQQLQAQGHPVAFVALLDSLDIEEIRRVGPRTFPEELIQQNPAIHNILPELIQEYVPHVYAGKVTLLRATQGEGLDQPNRERTDDPLFGWGQWAAGGVEAHDVPGGHYSLLQKPNVQVLAEKLEACIKRVETNN
ncbi:MAG TPA: condensation domain-containing protein [Waterburya sp.]